MKRARTFVIALIVGIAACSGGPSPNSVRYSPPPPLALVALVDPSSGDVAGELQQLAGVIRANASPNEAVVVMMLAPGSRTYTVRSGDSLSSIAAANGLTLQQIEAANPQFGPVAGRNWSVIHSGERLTIADRSVPNPLLLVTRAPAGPPPPMLIRLPAQPQNPTEYQRAQYEHAVAQDNATNNARIADWRAGADAALIPWQNTVAAQIESKAGAVGGVTTSAGAPALSASMAAGLATLGGLSGRRLLLVLGGASVGPSTLAPHSLAGVALVIANLADPGVATAWTVAGKGAGAVSVNALDPALTQLQLAQVVNS
ncbi:MAG TPA: LysM peptidoglycan-binding domain-containing protein [Candidatus Dormibacteraeota bacterium]|nr:LysM peptidoglycan-binding domain-containing protein [Candidatus Dormibacteraeota bacterium]